MLRVAQQPGQFFFQRHDQVRSHQVVVIAAPLPAVSLGFGAIELRLSSFNFFGDCHD